LAASSFSLLAASGKIFAGVAVCFDPRWPSLRAPAAVLKLTTTEFLE
jgi:hypothetical protein